MPERPDIWLVMHNEEFVAELAVERRFWLRGSVTRRERFEVLAPLFTREARLAATIGTTPGGWEAHLDVRRQLSLIRPSGDEVPEFILHIAGAQASWRCTASIAEPAHEANR
jgi:hypothetical protein